MKHTVLLAAALGLILAGCVGPDRSQLERQGIAQFQLGNLDQAETDFNQLVSAYPADATGLYYLGRICQARGEYHTAIFYYQSCLDADPAYQAARTALAQAQRVSGIKAQPFRYGP